MAKRIFDTSQNRLDYGEMLQPEPGYELVSAVGLAYSLDLEALLNVPISLGLLDEIDSSLLENPFYILEGIRKSSDKIAIFCNAGGMSLPQNIRSVYSLLEKSVFEIKLPKKQNFHPKLWFIKYKNKLGRAYIKFIVLSRNLTFDRSMDLAFEFSGEIGRRQNNKNKPLYDMISFLADYCSKDKKDMVLSLANDILYVSKFDVEPPFTEFEFLPLGIEGYSKDTTGLFDKSRDIFIISPFLSDDIVSLLTSVSGRKVLITRKQSITKKTMNSFDEVFITKDIFTDNEFSTKQDIHAKLYFTTCNDGNYLYIGSANASHNAFYKNVEFLIKLKYAPYMASFEHIYNDFIPDENCPFEKVINIPALEDEAEDKELELALKEAVWAIKGAKAIQIADSFNVEVYSRELKSGKTVKIAPLQNHNVFTKLEKTTLIENILLKQLSDFYILAVEDKKIVIKIETKGIPKERDEAIYKGIINSKPAFLTYINFMLSDNYAESAFELMEQIKLLSANPEKESGFDLTSAVYEKMLKSATQNPEKIKEIADVIEKLDKDTVGEEFIKMYQQFESVLRRLKK